MDTAGATATVKFASEQVYRRLGRLAFQINQIPKLRNSEAVHDLRVAVRRLSQALCVFKAEFRSKEFRKIRRKLKPIMNLAGQVRNCDIALELVSRAQRPDLEGLRHQLDSQRRESERVLVAFLKRWIDRKSSLKWRSIVASAVAANAESSNETATATTARQLLPRMSREFFERGNKAAKASSSRDLHEFRIMVKKFRYTLELFDSVYGPSLNSSVEHIKRVQGLLGEINDCDTVRQMLAKYKGGDRLTPWLKKRQRRRIGEFQRFWAETFAAGGGIRISSALPPDGNRRKLKKPASHVRRTIGRIRGNTSVA